MEKKRTVTRQLLDHFKQKTGDSCKIELENGARFWVDPDENGGYYVQPMNDLDHYMHTETVFEAAWAINNWNVRNALTVDAEV